MVPARELCRKYGIAEEDLSKAYRQLPRTPYRILRAAGDLLSFSAQALCQAQMARLVPGSLKERLNHFVSEHLAEDLSSERICTALGVGRTALYELSKQTYGCGIHEYVRQLRIRHAMQLLTTTKLTNSEICQKIGIARLQLFFPGISQADRFLRPRLIANSSGGNGLSADSVFIIHPASGNG